MTQGLFAVAGSYRPAVCPLHLIDEKMTETADCSEWEIVHIPEKPPVIPNQQPTVDVYAAFVDPKHVHSLIRKLNQIAPFENLRHVKRVRKKHVDGRKPELSVLLCLACENGNQLENIPPDVLEIINSFQLRAFLTKVCRYAALSKEEWEEQCKLWPTSYHPPTYNIDGITGFNEDESRSVFYFMNLAVDMAKSSNYKVVNAAVISDPSTKQVIASACDQLYSQPINETNGAISGQKETLPPTSILCRSERDKSSPPKCSSESEQLYDGVSCLYPWKWTEQTLHGSFQHPLRHAAVVAIEQSAARDRQLFPDIGITTDTSLMNHSEPSSLSGSPAKRQKTDNNSVQDDERLDCQTDVVRSESARPYLCTGYDIFLVWEPCPMCAMALVHQRMRRIFYAFPNPNAGALGSVHRLQGEGSLNHHYAVFRVMLPPQSILDPLNKSS